MNEGIAAKELAAHGEDAGAWGDNPWTAFGIRTAVFLVPIALSILVTWLIASNWSPPSQLSAAIIRLIVLGVVAMGVAMLTDKGAKRFLPLAALYRLSLVFPDQAPSRFAVALRSGNTKQIERRLAEIEAGGFSGSQADAALLIVELAAALSEHDRLTRGHSERVRAFTALIGEELALSDDETNKLQWAGLIHDVGKLRIPQEILTKPGKLTNEEFNIIKTHPDEGMKLAEPLREYLGEWIGAVGEHHEWFDGNGYPNGLAGEQISLGGRIVAVVDAYDVITAARSYKKPLPPEFARQELADNAGTQFDPDVVRAFLGISLGRLRRAMWPLSWAAQVPFLGPAITAPAAQAVAATVITLATATGVVSVAGPLVTPEAIAFADETPASVEEDLVVDGALPGPTSTAAPSVVESSVGPPTTTIEVAAPIDVGSSTTTDPSIASTTTTATPALSDAPTTNPDATTSTLNPDATTSTLRPTTTTTTPTKPTKPALLATTTTKVFRTTTTTKVFPTTTATTTPTTTTTTATTAPPADCTQAQAGSTQMQGADLRNCDFGAVTFSGADFSGADLTGASFDGTIISGGLFKGAIFDDATFNGANVWAADFRDASFVGVEIVESGFHDNNFTGVSFDGARLLDVGMNATLTNASFVGASITRVGFGGGVFVGTDLTGAIVQDSNFSFTNVDGANFDNARFVSTNFYGALNTPTAHTSASYTSVTCVDGLPYDDSCW